MKGDVGMSLYEKERNKMPTQRHKATHNPIPTSLFLPRLQRTFSCRQLDVKMMFGMAEEEVDRGRTTSSYTAAFIVVRTSPARMKQCVVLPDPSN